MADQQSAGSPWDEPIPENHTPKKIAPTVVGDLDVKSAGSVNAPGNPQPAANPTSLKVPIDTEEKVGVKVDASKTTGLEPKTLNSVPPTPAPAPQKPQPENFWQSVYGQQDNPQSAPAQASAAQVPLRQPNQTVAQTIASAPQPQNQSNFQKPQVQSQTPLAPQSPQVSSKSTPKLSSTVRYILAGVFGILILLSGSIYLTEAGLISLGLEKVYGAVRLEALWGGLPANAEDAFLMSVAEVKSKGSFKTSGTATLTVNKGIKSPIISPIVASAILPHISLRDESASRKILSELTVASDQFTEEEELEILEETEENTANPQNSGTNNGATNSPAVSSEPTVGSTESSTTSRGSITPTNNSNNTVEQLELEIESAITNSVSGANINIKSSKNTKSNVSLVTSNNKLYVKTSSDITYNSAAKTGWTKVDLNSIDADGAKKQFFSDSFASSDFSIVGQRTGSEKIDGVRCFRYSGKVSVGNALEKFGVKNSTVNSLDIDYWLGVKDHLIYKVEMKLIPSSESAVTRIDCVLTFSDYNSAEGQFSVPTTSVPYSSEKNSTNVNLETESGRDAQRKTDLASIAQALESYRSAVGRYPQVTGTLKISNSEGALYNALVPTYISSLPIDPKDPTYYYGYVSDGSSFKLSSVLENKADPQGKPAGNLVIYYLSSL